MKTQFDILRKVREIVAKIVSGLTIEQLHTIPEEFNNNIAWNVAHLVVTQQLLHYRLTGTDCLISEDMINIYRKGTSPSTRLSQEEFDNVLQQLKELPDALERDYNDGVFKEYTTYPTSTGFVLDSIDSAIAFNNMHESLHLGVIMSLRKLV